MCGLGVLFRNQEGRYRIRSPNLVRLMGTVEDIHSRLAELDKGDPSLGFSADNYHIEIGDASCIEYSPLNLSQEGRLLEKAFGFSLVTGSEALQIHSVRHALSHTISQGNLLGLRGISREIPDRVVEECTLEDWLESVWENNAEENQVYLSFVHNGVSQIDVKAWEDAWKVVRRHGSSFQRWMRILFLLPPVAVLEWTQLPEDERQRIVDRSSSLDWLQTWDLTAVQRQLKRCGKLESPEVATEVHRVTCGWPLVMEHVLRGCEGNSDPRPCLADVEQALDDQESCLHREFVRLSGLGQLGTRRELLDFLVREEGVPFDMVVPELAETNLSKTEFEAAFDAVQMLSLVSLSQIL